MKVCLFSLAGLLVFTYAGLSIGHAASAGDLKKAQAEAESEGYIFELSHDAIVAKAKKERGRLRGHVFQDPPTLQRRGQGVQIRISIRRPAH